MEGTGFSFWEMDMENISAMRQHQAVLAWVDCAKEIQQFIEKIPDGLLCELFYLCALDGMSLDELQRLDALPAKDRTEKAVMIWKERRIFLQKIYGNDPERERHREALHQETKQMFANSEKIWQKLEEGMAEILEMQHFLLEGQKVTNETVLDEKKKQIQEKEGKIQELEGQIFSLQEQCDRLQKENQQIKENVKKRDVRPKGFRGICWKVRRKAKADAFIAAYLENKEYSREQKEYLLQCLESGDSFREIKTFASPGLTIPMMERLRNLNRKPSAGQRKSS